MTPYYEQDGVTIYHGDALEIVSQIQPVDHVITDPPYGMGKGFANDDPEAADAIVRLVMAKVPCGGNVIAFWSAQRLDRIPFVFGDVERVMIWNKQWAIHAPNNVGYRYEPIVWVHGRYCSQKRGDIFECFPIIREVQQESQNHPTQKPEALMCELVGDFTGFDETVLDPFMGSGTTLVAAKRLGRKAIGIELEEKYCEIAAKRLRQGALPLEMGA